MTYNVQRLLNEALRTGQRYEASAFLTDTIVTVLADNHQLTVMLGFRSGVSSVLVVDEWRVQGLDPFYHTDPRYEKPARTIFDNLAHLLDTKYLHLFLQRNADQISGRLSYRACYDVELSEGGFVVGLFTGAWSEDKHVPHTLIYRLRRSAPIMMAAVTHTVTLPSWFKIQYDPALLERLRRNGVAIHFIVKMLFDPIPTVYRDITVIYAT